MINAFPKIDFICIGAAKSGTTALHRYLRAHPDIYMPLKKEIHHFADDLLKPDDYWLKPEVFFRLYKGKESRLKGETSVFYMLSQNAAQNIYKHNPKTKIIIMLRNPLEMAYSLHAQLVFNGEEQLSFEKAIEDENQRKQGRNLPESTRIKAKHCYIKAVDYLPQIKRFTDIFPEEQIKIILFDDFKNDTAACLQEIYEFLGADGNFLPKLKIHNSNKIIKHKRLQSFINTLSYKVLARFLHHDRTEAFREGALNLISRKQKRPPLKPEIRKSLLKRLKPKIQELEHKLNRNLSHWYE